MAKGKKEPTAPRNPVGRPRVYNPKLHPKLVLALAEQGLTDQQIADRMEITAKTLYEWYKKYPELSEAKKAGAKNPDDQVEASLFQRAIGYQHPAVKIFLPAGAKEPVIVPYTQYYPPDTSAIIWWTKNRRPDKWRDTRATEAPNIGETSPLKVQFDEVPKTLIDPEVQDNLEITE